MKRKTVGWTATLLFASASLAGCSGSDSHADRASWGQVADPSVRQAAIAAVQTDKRDIDFRLDRTKLPLRQWRSDGSHITTVTGRLLVGGKPVAGAILRSGTSRYDITTDQDGVFRWQVDQSQLSAADVRVFSLDRATIGGRPIRQDEAEQLLKSSAPLSVYYPIRVQEVREIEGGAGEVEVHARIVSAEGDTISFFQVDKYRIGGTVRDADGRPVRDAVVWIDRDGGEGFGKSTPTDARGEYQIFYLPDQEEGTNLAVVVGAKRYTLPKNKVLHIPDDTSVKIHITLPKEGIVINDQPPALTCEKSPGMMYTGVLAGLNVPPDTRYTVTIPDDEGNFVLKVAKEVWDRHPVFFEEKLTKFVEDRELEAGDSLPSSFLEPGANDPKNIAPEPEPK
ncbi:carboxypeptidase-like regulatory domain-containing protein [Cohnella lubricantis]|uniref:Carboxypeptidase regulatory-like domain-containing protein n=1 Tax=Cohnella lubricantis TaxID=2163172 RepID=A0A841TAF1_9BACL|nr:carboxypeptidase-like regulatory domain-containing protein [Cohnella lubricantis]MBB6676007.1 carboxypeptidase regulatory-like domain-containing protein [Cohnella lubricantis]MBP2117980.1 hypothetical protein [Cohnella lubricantis]